MNTVANIPEAVKLEDAACPLCGPSISKFVVAGHDNLYDFPGKFTIVECTTCHLKRTCPRPTADTIGYYYPADYGPYKGTIVNEKNTNQSGWKARLISAAKKVFDTKSTALPITSETGRMLEIGCASGSFLHFMAQSGWQVEGIEFSDDAANAARKLGYPVETGAVETVEKPSSCYDLIVGWMVLEHLHDPVGSLEKMATWAKPNGKLVVSVPNIGAKTSRFFGSYWHDLHLPNHLYHYDPKSILQVMDAGGWRVTKIHHHRTIFNLVASTGYWLRDHGIQRVGEVLIEFPERGGRVGAMLLFPIAHVLALFGQTGRMTVWAERKP